MLKLRRLERTLYFYSSFLRAQRVPNQVGIFRFRLRPVYDVPGDQRPSSVKRWPASCPFYLFPRSLCHLLPPQSGAFPGPDHGGFALDWPLSPPPLHTLGLSHDRCAPMFPAPAPHSSCPRHRHRGLLPALANLFGDRLRNRGERKTIGQSAIPAVFQDTLRVSVASERRIFGTAHLHIAMKIRLP